jgi:hypothetical protein
VGSQIISFRIHDDSLAAVRLLATDREEPLSETLRTMLRYAAQCMPADWKPE